VDDPTQPELLDRLRARRWAEPLLRALEGDPPVHLVGGAVRDLLLGRDIVDLDVVVEGDALPVARAAAERLGGKVREHDRFGTATVSAPELVFDVVTARRERYTQPGALPEVEAATLAEDLARRDFTVNALALRLTGADRGELAQAPGGLEDLRAGQIRVLHPASFRDDPTRLLRAARYAARLGFALEPGTEALARDALSAGALDTVSGARVRDELMDLLGESQAPEALALARALGLDRALHPGAAADPQLARRALAVAPADARPALVLLASLLLDVPDTDRRALLDRLAVTAGERDVVLASAQARGDAATLGAVARPSEIAAVLGRRPPEAAALAAALGAEAPARRWLDELRDVRLEIDGDDLLEAGAEPGPALGAALRAALDRRLDGEAVGREAELAAALDELGLRDGRRG
jgi:tRNA nucleotidyltransferase (CCA-adding enzyme)